MACSLFNTTLEYAIRKSDIQKRGTIFYKLVHLIVYADDIVIIGRSLASMKEGFQLFEEASKETGLVINKDKTKYMVTANTQICSKPRAICIGRYDVERVDSFMYLSSLMTIMSQEKLQTTIQPLIDHILGKKSQFKSQEDKNSYI